jgi:hypothetical protein
LRPSFSPQFIFDFGFLIFDCADASRLKPALYPFLPLLKGEGRGEGEERVESSTRPENSAARPLTPTLSPDGGEGVETAVQAQAPASSIQKFFPHFPF